MCFATVIRRKILFLSLYVKNSRCYLFMHFIRGPKLARRDHFWLAKSVWGDRFWQGDQNFCYSSGAEEAILHWSGKIQLTKSLLIQSVAWSVAVSWSIHPMQEILVMLESWLKSLPVYNNSYNYSPI